MKWMMLSLFLAGCGVETPLGMPDASKTDCQADGGGLVCENTDAGCQCCTMCPTVCTVAAGFCSSHD